MEKPCCCFDSFDAIFKCICGFYLCPKHAFSHSEEFPQHNIERVKISVNNESRQVLMKLIITIKKKCVVYANQYLQVFCRKELNEEYTLRLSFFGDIFDFFDRILLFLITKQFISMELFYTPLKWFLIQPPDKVENFVSYFELPEKAPEDFSEFWHSKIYNFLIYFNYFKFEDKRYIHGWNYQLSFDINDLSFLYRQTLLAFIRTFEYEMALELLENMLSIQEFCQMDIESVNCFRILANIIYKLASEKNYLWLQEKLTELEIYFLKANAGFYF